MLSPLERLRHHVSGAIARGETVAVVAQVLSPKVLATLDAMSDRSAQGYADALCSYPSTHDATALEREYAVLSHLKHTRGIVPSVSLTSEG